MGAAGLGDPPPPTSTSPKTFLDRTDSRRSTQYSILLQATASVSCGDWRASPSFFEQLVDLHAANFSPTYDRATPLGKSLEKEIIKGHYYQTKSFKYKQSSCLPRESPPGRRCQS